MLRRIALLALIAALLVGCAPTPAAPTATPTPAPTQTPAGPSAEYDIKGNISDARPGDGQLADVLCTIRIEGEKIAGNRYDKAVVAVSKSTRILEKTPDGYVPATCDDLQFGALVTAKFTGPVLESYPVQASAAEIVLLARMPKQ